MPRIHFLNVNDGDCSVIQHASGRNTVIDISAAKLPAPIPSLAAGRVGIAQSLAAYAREKSKVAGVLGNFKRSLFPDNPSEYLNNHAINSIFRFICTHPDMDHLDGIKQFFTVFQPVNFWDTDNTKSLDAFGHGYNSEDWRFYRSLRDQNPQSNPKRLTLYSGDRRAFFKDDGLSVLAPTRELVKEANRIEDWNDCSYVILYRSQERRILFCGDSHDKTWAHILSRWRTTIRDIDVLIAPHHGRHSSRDFEFLDVVAPKLTLFGNAPSDHLSYDAWNNRDLLFITNNQAGTIVLDLVGGSLKLFCCHQPFAHRFCKQWGNETFYHPDIKGWFLGELD